eukprot:9653734-Heterocapsa_arctica.AAC.1
MIYIMKINNSSAAHVMRHHVRPVVVNESFGQHHAPDTPWGPHAVRKHRATILAIVMAAMLPT